MEIAAAAMTALVSAGSTVASTVGSAMGITEAVGATAAASTGLSAAGSSLLANPFQLAGVGGATAGAGSMFGGSMFANILQGGMGLMSAMAASREGAAKADALEMQAQDAKFDAKTEEINAINRQASLRRELTQSLGQRDAAYAASGVDLSFGTPEVARGQALDDANRAISGDQADAEMRAGRLRERAGSFRRMAEDARTAGSAKGLGAIGQSVLGMVRRG